MEIKRLFFGMPVAAPWPESFPRGRILAEQNRHLTVAFLGNVDKIKLLSNLKQFQPLPFGLGLPILFDRPLFLPPHSPRTAGWHFEFLEHGCKEKFLSFRQEFLSRLDIQIERSDFLCHVTIARGDFDPHQWEQQFELRPGYLSSFSLYESLGHSEYLTLWTYPLLAPFEELEHTADIAFLVRGRSLDELYLHAALALSFNAPPLIAFFRPKAVQNLEHLISNLNEMVFRMDCELGCPFKAVSFHGKIQQQGNLLEWEMIVDV